MPFGAPRALSSFLRVSAPVPNRTGYRSRPRQSHDEASRSARFCLILSYWRRMPATSEARVRRERVSMADIAFYLAAASAVSILFSIAVSQILLALGVVALLLSGLRVRFPPILLPLGLFMAGTVVSLLLSADPAGGRPQIRKFFVFLIVMVVYSTARSLARVRGILLVATAIVSFSALWSFVQFVDKWRQARAL